MALSCPVWIGIEWLVDDSSDIPDLTSAYMSIYCL